MTVHEKIALLRTMSNMNQDQFASLIRVHPSTVTRLENENSLFQPAPETLQSIANIFNEVTVDWLTNEDDETVPDKLTSPVDLLQQGAGEGHEGRNLGAFIDRFDRHTLNNAMIARELNVSRPQIGHYRKTTRFQPAVRESLLAAISKLLHRTVTDAELFGSGADTAVNPVLEKFIEVPKLALNSRSSLSSEGFKTLQSSFAPVLEQDTLHVPVEYVPASRFRQAIAIEVGPADQMEPLFLPGYWVLGFSLSQEEYSRHYAGSVAVLTNDGEFLVRQIVANRLKTADTLELGPYMADRDRIRAIRRSDIALFFSITHIVRGSLQLS